MRAYRYTIKREFTLAEGTELYHVRDPESTTQFLKSINLHTEAQEKFVVLFLDTRNQIVGYQEISQGLIDRSHVHPREVFRGAILNNTSKIILAHNHPSGRPEPSPQDLASNSNLIEAGIILGIKVIDHIIVAEDAGRFTYTSLREQGLMT